MRAVWLLALLLTTPVALAHGDAPPEVDSVTLEPGSSVSWSREIHWHRLVGTVEATGPVTVTVEGPGGSVLAAGPGDVLEVNHLVACCRETTWSPHTVHVTNAGDDTVEARFDLVLLHDNLAVVAHDSEPGAWWQTLLIVGLLIAIPAWRARAPSIREPAGPWLRWSRILHATAWASAGLLAVLGMVRFGGGPLAGSVASTVWAPLDAGFFNTHSFVMLGLMVLWGAAVACWAGARRRAGSPARYRWDGLAFAAGSILVGLLMVYEFDRWLLPLVVGLLPAMALLADGWWPARTTDPGP